MRHLALPLSLSAVFAILLAANPAPVKDKVVYQKRTVFNLTETQINGEVERPTGTIVQSRKASRFAPYLLLRGNFAPELLGSVEEL